MNNNNTQSHWNVYMRHKGAPGQYYIVKPGIKSKIYGPFKNKEIAEFFNFMAFGDPHSATTRQESQVNIEKIVPKVEVTHPSQMFASNSKINIWWSSVFDLPLTSSLVLRVAKASGAQGYQSFIDWLHQGSQIDGQHIMTLCYD